MNREIFLGHFKHEDVNPLDDSNYKSILGLLPTLNTEIRKRIFGFKVSSYNSINFSDINTNESIIDKFALEKEKKVLIQLLHDLTKITKNTHHINLLTDDCFTNDLLIKVLINILGIENCNKFVNLKSIDLRNIDSGDIDFEDNTLNIIGGSLSDTYSIDNSYYHGKMANDIKNILDDSNINSRNRKIFGVCFGQQYLANLLGIQNSDSSSIIATYKGLAQFGPSNCKTLDLTYINHTFKNALNGVTNYGKNKLFSTYFTRTGHVDFDLLKTGSTLGIIPLIKDEMTGKVVGWGAKNGNVMGVQFHPEITFLDNREFIINHIKDIIPYLTNYKDAYNILDNFDDEGYLASKVKEDIGEAFYTYVLSSFLSSIKENYKQHIDINSSSKLEQISKYSYVEAFDIIRNIIINRVDSILSLSNPNFNNNDHRISFLKKIDEAGRLLLNDRLDWKVNRGIKETSNVLGFNDLGDFFNSHIDFLKKVENRDRVYYFRDWGAGDGSLLKDMYSKYKGKDIIFYGVGDYIYFDIFPGLKNKGLELGIPLEVLILFFEDFLDNYRVNKSNGNVLNKVKNVLEDTSISKIHKIHNSSITSDTTKMFGSEDEFDLSIESIDFIKNNKSKINDLKYYLITNFYNLFEGYFERIYVSKFNDFEFSNNMFSSIDFQVAIRSTSHIDNQEYIRVIDEYINKNANPGSIYIDNGVHRSYTSTPRLPELNKISKIHNNTKINLIYDSSTNYFTSAIISKSPYLDEEEIKKSLKEGFIIVPLDEAYNSTFFKLEYFIRSFIIGNFKNYDVFWDFNKDIIFTLKQIMHKIDKNDVDGIKELIINLINHISKNYKSGSIEYDLIDNDIINSYSINDETLDDIIGGELYMPNWLNINVLRNN